MRYRRAPQIHRKPPPLPFHQAPTGTCRFCGQPVQKPARNWHQECADQWTIANSPSIARRAVWEAAGGFCRECGRAHPAIDQGPGVVPLLPDSFAVDHIVPLWEAPKELKYWLIGNLQLLCVEPCHRLKSAEEAKRRGQMKQAERVKIIGQEALVI